MTIYNLYVFDRMGTCLHYGEWHRKKSAGMPKEEEFKLMYGMIFSMKSFIARMAPTDQQGSFLNLQTSKYKLHFYESPSGLKLVMNTDLAVPDSREVLHQLYSDVFLEYAVKNPLCSLEEPIQSDLFKSKIDEFIKSLPIFSSKVS